ncbi:hypothetical protein ACFL3J_02135 [Candidatus Omnitrophota bacterium]
MKKLIALVIVLTLTLCVAPAFAQKGAKTTMQEPSLFQQAHDTLIDFGRSVEATSENETMFKSAAARISDLGTTSPDHKAKDVVVFSSAKNYVDTWDSSFANAKLLTLKDNPEELAKRRGNVRY